MKRVEAEMLLCLMVNCICCSAKYILVLQSVLHILCLLFHEVSFFILKTISSPYRFAFSPSIFCISFHRNLSKIVLIEICESRNIDCLIEERRETPRRIGSKISNVALLFQCKTAMTLYSGVF